MCVWERESVCVSSHEVSANQSAVTDSWTNKGSHSSVIAPSVNRWPFDLGLVHRNDRDRWTRDLDHNEANTLINYIDPLPRLIASASINKVTSYRIIYRKFEDLNLNIEDKFLRKLRLYVCTDEIKQ